MNKGISAKQTINLAIEVLLLSTFQDHVRDCKICQSYLLKMYVHHLRESEKKA